MLLITIPGIELWNEDEEQFEYGPATTLKLEHSLLSISKWESKWHKPFIENQSNGTWTAEETLDYIKCMTITTNVDPDVYTRLTPAIVKQITDYIDDPHTATWFGKKRQKPGPKRVITSEVIYYQMIALNIPVEFERWHINRLLTLIRVCDEENQPANKKKRPQKEVLNEYAAINAKRRAERKARKEQQTKQGGAKDAGVRN